MSESSANSARPLSTIVLVPGALGLPGQESLLTLIRSELAAFREINHLVKVHHPSSLVAWAGLRPEKHVLSGGALSVAGMGFEPPMNAVRFAIDFLSLDSSNVIYPGSHFKADEWVIATESLQKLNSKSWTLVFGELGEAALVWENGSTEHRLFSSRDVFNQKVNDVCPAGEGDEHLRQLIEDAHDVLTHLEFNHRRRNEGAPVLNLWWPHSSGFGVNIPKLSLRHGRPVEWISNRSDVRGLARLTGCTHQRFETGFKAQWPLLKRRAPARIIIIDGIQEARLAGRLDRAEEHLARLIREFVGPQISPPSEPLRAFQFALLGDNDGLIVSWESWNRVPNRVPLEEEIREDPRIPTKHLWESIDALLSV